MKYYLIKKLWHDSMASWSEPSQGYSSYAVTDSEAKAKQFCAKNNNQVQNYIYVEIQSLEYIKNELQS